MNVSKWLSQAATIERQSRRISELEADKKDLLWLNGELNKQIVQERNKKDKYVLEFSNACAKLAGLGQTKLFSEVRKEQEVPERKETYSQQELEKFTWYAEQMRQGDIDAGKLDVAPLSDYVEAIKLNPQSYIFS